MTGQGRRAGIDVTRVMLALLVAGGHALLYRGLPDTAGAALLNGVGRLTVPFFLIVSGFYFPARPERFRAWAVHVLRLYLFWTVVFLPFLVTLGSFSWAKLVFYLAVGYAHLWYLPALLCGGAMLWWLRDWPVRRLLGLSLGLFLAGWAVQTAENLLLDFATLSHRNAWLSLARNFLFFGFPFLALGHVLARVRTAPSGALLAAALILGLALLAGEAMVYREVFGTEGFFDLFLGVLVAAPALFLLVGRVPLAVDARWLAPLSSAIYFVHPLFIFLLATTADLPRTVELLLVLALSALASWGLLLLARRVPVI